MDVEVRILSWALNKKGLRANQLGVFFYALSDSESYLIVRLENRNGPATRVARVRFACMIY